MTRELNGQELAGFIKERQARQVRALRQAHHIVPKLVILKTPHASPVIDTYVRMKRRYGEDILIETEIRVASATAMKTILDDIATDETVHGVIVQLPLDDLSMTDEVLAHIPPEKDVDGLGGEAQYVSATAEAINWLLNGYGVELMGKHIILIGRGRLVGAPLEAMWRASGYNVEVLGRDTVDLAGSLRTADVVVTATGAPRLVTPDMLKPGAIVVDAGTASEDGVIVGDLDPAVRERDDLMLTPEKGGVGPLTIVALFDHVIQAATRRSS